WWQGRHLWPGEGSSVDLSVRAGEGTASVDERCDRDADRPQEPARTAVLAMSPAKAARTPLTMCVVGRIDQITRSHPGATVIPKHPAIRRLSPPAGQAGRQAPIPTRL